MRSQFRQRSKYGAKRTNRYASKAESAYADELRLRKEATNGDVIFWIEQVPIKLSIGKYVVDFMVVTKDAQIKFVEVKGIETAAYKLKMLALQNERPEIYSRLEVVERKR